MKMTPTFIYPGAHIDRIQLIQTYLEDINTSMISNFLLSLPIKLRLVYSVLNIMSNQIL